MESSTSLGGFRALKKTLEAPSQPKRTIAVPLAVEPPPTNGFTVAPEPSTLDDSLVDRSALSTCAGRRTAGKVTSATPRLVKKFNHRIVWAVTAASLESGEAASRQLWPWVTRSLQLVGHLDSNYRPGTEALRLTRALHCAPVCPLLTPLRPAALPRSVSVAVITAVL